MTPLSDFLALVKTKLSRYASPIFVYTILGACICYLLSVSWLKWGDLIIDTYRDLWLPTQINEGRVLYKDIFYPFGFFAPYLLASAYRLSGVCIYAAVACGIAITVAMSLVIYNISRFFLDELFSLLTTLTFLFVFAFGNISIFNFILPYTFASTFCILFIASALYFFIKFIFTEEKKYIFFWSVFLTFAFFSRPEMPLPTHAAFILIAVLLAAKNKNINIKRTLLWSVSPLIIAAGAYSLLLFKNRAFGGFADSIFGYLAGPAINPLSVKMTGFNNILLNTTISVRSFLSHLCIVFLLGLATRALSSFISDKEHSLLKAIAGLALVFLACLVRSTYLSINIQYRCMPLVLISGSVLFLVRAMRHRGNHKENLSLATLFLVASTNILRIFFITTPFGYGFYLLSISLICYYIFFVKILKHFISHHIKVEQRLYSLVLAVFFAGMIVPYWQLSRFQYAMKTLKADTDMGTFFSEDNSRSSYFCDAVNYLITNTAKDDKVVVFPEGIGINFFAGKDMPLRHYNFVPYEILSIGEDNIISDLARFEIDYVIILSRPTAEYDHPGGFGIDYAKRLYSWIRENYEVVKEFGPTPYSSNQFGLTIFKKKA